MERARLEPRWLYISAGVLVVSVVAILVWAVIVAVQLASTANPPD